MTRDEIEAAEMLKESVKKYHELLLSAPHPADGYALWAWSREIQAARESMFKAAGLPV